MDGFYPEPIDPAMTYDGKGDLSELYKQYFKELTNYNHWLDERRARKAKEKSEASTAK